MICKEKLSVSLVLQNEKGIWLQDWCLCKFISLYPLIVNIFRVEFGNYFYIGLLVRKIRSSRCFDCGLSVLVTLNLDELYLFVFQVWTQSSTPIKIYSQNVPYFTSEPEEWPNYVGSMDVNRLWWSFKRVDTFCSPFHRLSSLSKDVTIQECPFDKSDRVEDLTCPGLS